MYCTPLPYFLLALNFDVVIAKASLISPILCSSHAFLFFCMDKPLFSGSDLWKIYNHESFYESPSYKISRQRTASNYHRECRRSLNFICPCFIYLAFTYTNMTKDANMNNQGHCLLSAYYVLLTVLCA